MPIGCPSVEVTSMVRMVSSISAGTGSSGTITIAFGSRLSGAAPEPKVLGIARTTLPVMVASVSRWVKVCDWPVMTPV